MIVYRHRERVPEMKEVETMTYTYDTPNPHGRIRDLLVDEMLLALEARGEDVPTGEEEEE